MEEQSSTSDTPQFYEVVVMDGNKPEEGVLDTSADGITVTLKDSTTDEDVPMSVTTSEEVLVPQNVVSQGDIQIAELQTAGGQEVSVVYTSVSDVPQIRYINETAVSTETGELPMQEEEGQGLQHKIVVQGNEGNQQIVIGEVQSLPHEIQASILNTIGEIQTAKLGEDGPEVSETMDIGEDNEPVPGPVAAERSLQGNPSIRSVSSITTCSRNDQPLDDMVPPQILATEDENTGPDDIPMETEDGHIISQATGESLTQEHISDLAVSEEERVLDGGTLTKVVEIEEKTNSSAKDCEEVGMAKFVPLILSPVKDSKPSDDIPIDKPRIVSISHGRAGSEGNGQMDVPNFMDGTDGDDINSQEGISLVQGGAAILTSVDDVSVSQTYTISPSIVSKSGESGEAKYVGEGPLPESLLVNVESSEPVKAGAKTDGASSTGKSTPDGKQKGKKRKNEMLHGMQLLSECAMRLENQDESPDEEGPSVDDPSKETQSEALPLGRDENSSALANTEETTEEMVETVISGDPAENEEVNVDEDVEVTVNNVEISVDDVGIPTGTEGAEIAVKDGVNISVTNGEEVQAGDVVGYENTVESNNVEETIVGQASVPVQEVELMQPVVDGSELVTEVAENAGPLHTTTEVVVTSEGQVLKAVPGSNFVPLEIGNSQEVVIDSQQISEELIPMVQEEVILEIVEGDQIIVNSSGASHEPMVHDFYQEQTIDGNKTYLPVQQISPVQEMMPLIQPGMPTSHRLQTYSQELKHAKKKSKKKASKRKKSSSPVQRKKQIKAEPRSSSDTSKQKYQCHVCQKLFDKMKELRDHLLVHYNTKGYVCDFCNKTFSSSSHLRRHVMIHTGERPHKCDYCGEGFIQAVQLRVHKQRHGHGPPPPLSRAAPKRSSDSSSGAGGSGTKKSRKKRAKVDKEKPTEKGEKYQCPICKVKHKSKKKIKAHMKTHVTVKNFKCSQCTEVFINKNQLTIHEARHKGKSELQCSYCFKAFDTTSHMKRHERIHTGEKPYKCKFCDKCFIQGVQLRLHERIHTGERPHVCTFCGKAFARTQYLKRHSCIHTGEKPLQCRFCLERFIQPVQRQVHEKKMHKKKLKKLLAQKQKPGQPPIKLVLRLKKKKGRKGEDEVTDSDDSDSESESSDSNDSN